MARRAWARMRLNRSTWTSPISSRRSTGSVDRRRMKWIESWFLLLFLLNFTQVLTLRCIYFQYLNINLQIIVLVVLIRVVSLCDHVKWAVSALLWGWFFLVVIIRAWKWCDKHDDDDHWSSPPNSHLQTPPLATESVQIIKSKDNRRPDRVIMWIETDH